MSIQARFNEDTYPIGRLIVDRASALGLSRSDLVRRLQYQDIGKGHKALSAALATGRTPPLIAANLADALETEQTLVDAVMAATTLQQQDEYRARSLTRETAYRARFQPHLRTETERVRPEPLFIAALIGTARLRHVELSDEAWSASGDERNWLIGRVIRGHYREHGGWVPSYGPIVGYTLATMAGYRVDFGFPYDRDGNPAGPMQAVDRLDEALLGTKRRGARLTGILSNPPIGAIPVGRNE
jgi:hypothetical protein